MILIRNKKPGFPALSGLEFVMPQGTVGDIMADLNGHGAHVSDAHMGGQTRHVLTVMVVKKKPTLPPIKDSRDD